MPQYVYMSPINPDGSLGDWIVASPALPHGGNDTHAAVAYNGYIYDFGGEYNEGAGDVISDRVYYAPIGSDGTIGSWATTTPLPVPTSTLTPIKTPTPSVKPTATPTIEPTIIEEYPFYQETDNQQVLGLQVSPTDIPKKPTRTSNLKITAGVFIFGGLVLLGTSAFLLWRQRM